MDRVLQVTSRLGVNMVEFGNELNNALALLGNATLLDFSLTFNAGVYTAVATYRDGGLPLRAVGAQSTNPAVPSWVQIDAALQAFPNHYALFIRSIPPEDDRDLPQRQLLVVFSIGSPGTLPGNISSLRIAHPLGAIAPGANGPAQFINGLGLGGEFVTVRNAGTAAWGANTRAYVFLDAHGVWNAYPRCC